MNKVFLNVIRLNSENLNLVGSMRIGHHGSGGGDTPVVPDAPEGYAVFMAADGAFLAADGEFYVKL